MSQQMMDADQLATILLHQMLETVLQENEIVLPRAQLRPQNHIRYFERRGIKTDLSAIEKYVDEMLECVGGSADEFVASIRTVQGVSEAGRLSEMQNSDIGTFTHFYRKPPGVLGVNTFVEMERCRNEQPGQAAAFEVTDEELAEDSVDRNYLVECQHIHNKVLFDCINDSLN